MTDRLITDTKDGILHLRFDLTGANPTLPPKILEAMADALDRASRDSRVAVALMYADSGLSDSEVAPAQKSTVADVVWSFGGLPLLDAWCSFSKPTICAVEGRITESSLELISASDICIAGECATFHDVGCGTARHNAVLSSSQALALGLVSRVVAQGEAVAQGRATAHYIAKLSRPIVQELKHLLKIGGRVSPEDGLKEEAAAFSRMFALEDRIEGTGAALQGRAPRFKNR